MVCAVLQPLLSIALAYENLLLVLPIRYQTFPAQETGWVMNGESDSEKISWPRSAALADGLDCCVSVRACVGGWVAAPALIPPLFLVICFETGYVIHKERSVRYLGINFDVSGRPPLSTRAPPMRCRLRPRRHQEGWGTDTVSWHAMSWQ